MEENRNISNLVTPVPAPIDNHTIANYQDNPPDFTNDIAVPSPPHRRSHSETSLDLDNPLATKNQRVTVEDVEDEDENYWRDNGRYFEQLPNAGRPLREGQTGFERYQQYKQEEGEDEWAPFCDE